jgi:hypothetical protein
MIALLRTKTRKLWNYVMSPILHIEWAYRYDLRIQHHDRIVEIMTRENTALYDFIRTRLNGAIEVHRNEVDNATMMEGFDEDD